MSGNIFECSVKHNDFNACQQRLQMAQNNVVRVADVFSDAVKNKNDLSIGLTFAALSKNNQSILDDIACADVLLAQVDEHYKDISNANSGSRDVWRLGRDIKVKFDEMRTQYEEGRDGILQHAEHMKVSYDQVMILMEEGDGVSVEDFDAVCQDLQASSLDA
ncbi:MAG: hypothetical protein COB14_09020 [Alphaproteobacteria bacterium]|nr:MAG: hypothetical protein COB14_09020 [Alphaproteobacteria bacterium]